MKKKLANLLFMVTVALQATAQIRGTERSV